MPQVRITRNTGVYAIRNKVDKKCYVGSATSSLSNRRRQHLQALRNGTHYNSYLQNAWNTYGEQSFEFVILETCTPDTCIQREQYWIDRLQVCDRSNGYNRRTEASNNRGIKWTKESKDRLSAAQIGKKHTEETKRRMSIGHVLQHQDPLKKARHKAALKGKIVSVEARANMSRVRIGKKLSGTHIESIKKSWDDEQKRLNRINGMKAAWSDPTIRAKRIEAMKDAIKRRKNII